MLNTEELIEWLQERIAILEVEKQASPFMDIKLCKGAKAKGLKECLNYIMTHDVSEPQKK